MMRLMARYADYSTHFRVNTVGQLPPEREVMDAACRDASRDPATLRRTLALLVDLPGYPTDPNGCEPKLWDHAAAFDDAFG